MSKILNEKQINLNQDVLASILANYGISKFTYKIPDSGISNTNVILETAESKYFLRVLRQGKKSLDELTVESLFVSRLYSKGLPVAKIIKNKSQQLITLFEKDGTLWHCQLFDFIEGKIPDFTLFAKDLAFMKNLAFLQAKILLESVEFAKDYRGKKIESLSQTSNAKIIENLLQDIDVAGLQNSKIKDLIDSRFELYESLGQEKLTLAWLHDDINVSNILLKENQIQGILDFDEFYFGPVISCLVNTAFEFVRFRDCPEIVFAYLHYFEEHFPLIYEDKKLIKNLLRLRNLMFIVYLTKFHGESFKFINNHLELNLKIKEI